MSIMVFDAETKKYITTVDPDEFIEEGYNCELFDSVDLEGDSIAVMMKLQDTLQKRLGLVYNSRYIMDQVLYAEAELQEMLREIKGFKSWKKYDWTEKEALEHKVNAKEEYIDVLHFIINIGNALGFLPSEMKAVFVNKNIVNHTRQDEGY